MRTKILSIVLGLFAAAAVAQNVAVRFSRTNETAFPTNWPSSVRDIGRGTNIPAGFDVIMTTNQLAKYIQDRRALYDGVRTAVFERERAQELATRQAYVDLIERIELAQREWRGLSVEAKNEALADGLQLLVRVARAQQKLKLMDQ